MTEDAISFDDISFDDAPSPDSGLQEINEGGTLETTPTPKEATKEASEENSQEATPSEGSADGETDGSEKEADGTEELAAVIEAVDGTKIPENTIFRKKVDGKPVEFTAKQAIDEYTGKLSLQPRFAEANRIKQKAEHLHATTSKQLNEAKELINAFFTHTKNGEHRDAIAALTKFTGSDPDEQWEQFQALQADNFKRIAEMSPEQLREAQLKEENEYYKRQVERNASQTKESTERQEIDAKISESSTKWGIGREAFEDGYNWLLDMKNKGDYNGPIDVATCAEAGYDLRTWAAIDEVVGTELPDKKGDNSFYQEVLNDTKRYGLTKNDWIKILDKAKKAKTAPASPSALERKKSKNAPLAQKKDAKKVQDSSPEFWDDI